MALVGQWKWLLDSHAAGCDDRYPSAGSPAPLRGLASIAHADRGLAPPATIRRPCGAVQRSPAPLRGLASIAHADRGLTPPATILKPFGLA